MYYTGIDFHSSDYSMYVLFLLLRGFHCISYAKPVELSPKGLWEVKRLFEKETKTLLKKFTFYSFSFLNEIVWDKSMCEWDLCNITEFTNFIKVVNSKFPKLLCDAQNTL